MHPCDACLTDMADPARKRRFDQVPDSGFGGAGRKQRLDVSGLGITTPAGVKEGCNPYTGRPYSARYYEILSKRKKLPVYDFLDELLTDVKKNQVGTNSCIV